MLFLRILLSVLMMVGPGALTASFAGSADYVQVTIDQARLIRLKADASQIIIGNPVIADVTAQDSRLLVVTGKSFGTTNLIVLDDRGQEVFRADLGVRESDVRHVTLYKGTMRQSYHCAPDCQRTLSIGDDKSRFEELADTVSKKFGVVNSVIGAK